MDLGGLTWKQRKIIEALSLLNRQVRAPDDNMALKIQAVVRKTGLPKEVIVDYLDRLDTIYDHEHFVTLYYSKELFDQGRECFAFQRGLEPLPSGSVPCGTFIAGQIATLFQFAIRRDKQKEDLYQKIVWGLLVAGEMNAEAIADILLKQGFARIHVYYPELDNPEADKVDE